MGRYYESYWPPYVPVAERRRRAAQKVAKMKKAGQKVSPVEITGRKQVTLFEGFRTEAASGKLAFRGLRGSLGVSPPSPEQTHG